MQVKAKVKHLRISARKARLVVNEVRGLDLNEAMNKLAIIDKKAVTFVDKLLKSAAANAKENNELELENLYIKDIRVDEGQTFYRWMPRAHGRATPKRKKTCHISVILEEKKATKPKAEKKQTEIATTKLDMDNEKEVKELTSDKKDDNKVTKETGPKGPQDKGMLKKMFRRKSGM